MKQDTLNAIDALNRVIGNGHVSVKVRKEALGKLSELIKSIQMA